MDEQKVTQVLKEIFDKYGAENLRNGKIRKTVVKSYIPDMLNKVEYRDENLVLTQAMRSDAICSLVTANVTGDDVKRAVDRLESEEHMRREDAEFVARCIILACGGSPDAVMFDRRPQVKRTDSERMQHAERSNTGFHRSKRNIVILVFLDVMCIVLLFGSVFLMLDDGPFYWGGIAMPLTALTAFAEIICRVYVRLKKKSSKKGFIEDHLGICIVLTIISLLLFFIFYLAPGM